MLEGVVINWQIVKFEKHVRSTEVSVSFLLLLLLFFSFLFFLACIFARCQTKGQVYCVRCQINRLCFPKVFHFWRWLAFCFCLCSFVWISFMTRWICFNISYNILFVVIYNYNFQWDQDLIFLNLFFKEFWLWKETTTNKTRSRTKITTYYLLKVTL